MNKMRIVLTVFLIASISFTANADCDIASARTCYKEYFKSMGFLGFEFPPLIARFIERYVKVLLTESNSVEQTCGYYHTLFTCLGSNSDCITTDNLRSVLRTNEKTALDYVVVFNVQNFICNNGITGFLLLKGENNGSFRSRRTC